MDEDGFGQIDSTINFTNNDNYTVNVKMVNSVCNPNDVGAPANIVINIAKVNGVWNGGAALYSPRWWGEGAELTCTDPVTSSTESFMITRFIGDEAASKVEVAMMKDTVTTIDDTTMNSWQISEFINNFSDGTCGGFCPDLSAYTIPFCSLGSSSYADWGDDCSGTNLSIANSSFVSTGLIAPSELDDLVITLPTSL